MKNDHRTTFDYIVVLSGTRLNKNGEFDEQGKNGLYFGGHVRMLAVIRAYKTHACPLVLVAGGANKMGGARWETALEMRQFLEDNGIPRHDMVCVASGENTLGNFRALHKVYSDKLRGKTVGVLTNFYHVPRAMRMVQDAQFDWGGACFIPLAGESVLGVEPTGALDELPGYTHRIAMEIKGLGEWERGEYDHQFALPSAWIGDLKTD